MRRGSDSARQMYVFVNVRQHGDPYCCARCGLSVSATRRSVASHARSPVHHLFDAERERADAERWALRTRLCAWRVLAGEAGAPAARPRVQMWRSLGRRTWPWRVRARPCAFASSAARGRRTTAGWGRRLAARWRRCRARSSERCFHAAIVAEGPRAVACARALGWRPRWRGQRWRAATRAAPRVLLSRTPLSRVCATAETRKYLLVDFPKVWRTPSVEDVGPAPRSAGTSSSLFRACSASASGAPGWTLWATPCGAFAWRSC